MARIPDQDVDRIKREVPVQRLAESRGVKLKRHGADLLGLCPFHDDKKPSLVVSPAKNLWHCLGACQSGGSAIDWVMKAEGVGFRHAVELLRSQLSPLAACPVTETKREPRHELDATDQELLRQAVAYYHDTLKRSPEALAYLERRGLRCDEMIERFRLGYANRTLTEHLGARGRNGSGDLRTRLQRLGLVRESGHEHFNGSLVVPILDDAGRVTEIYGRKIRDDLRDGTPVHLYLPGGHCGVFNIEALASSQEIILCEALLDALTFWCAGFRNVTSSYGVEGFTSDHLSAFKRYGTKRVLLAYDRDDAGERAAEALAKKLIAQGLDCYRIQFPKSMDANEYALKVKPAPKSLGLAVRRAAWLGEGPPPPIELGGAKKDAAAKGENGPPAPPEIQLPTEVKPDELVLHLDDRRYRIRGLARNQSPDQLRVNLLCGRGDRFYIDTLDLYAARHRAAYLKQAAKELESEEESLKKDLAAIIRTLEEIQQRELRKTLAPKSKAPTMTEEEKREAMALLQDPKLLDRILADFDQCGVVGEETSKLVGYLGAVSRKLEEPLAVIIQSSSAAGKTSLMESILAFVPEEERVKYSAMTGQSLFYMGESDLKHKVLAVVEETGAQRASYALKLLQSEGELTIASTGKDPTTGRLVTHEYRVEGPVMILLTTTAVDIDDELLNRCLLLTVTESREQTRAIHQLQRECETLEGLLARQDRERILKVHRNAQRLLRPILVANPYARALTFLDDRTRTRRDHMKYLTLIRSVALLQQYQRPVKTLEHHGRTVEYIEVTLEDIAIANRLAHEVLGRSLDELAPQTRRLLMLLDEMVTGACERLTIERSEYRFTRREVREHTGWGNTQLKVHLHRLEELEYLALHRGGRGQSFVYELVYDGKGKDGTLFLSGLLDVEKLREYDPNRSGSQTEWSGPGRAQVGPKSAIGRAPATSGTPSADADSRAPSAETPKKAAKGEVVRSYVLQRGDPALPSLAAGPRTEP